MGPKSFRITFALLLVAAIALIIIPADDWDAPANVSTDAVPPGHYPPAPSTAVGMTPEWREFADQVDRVCAESFNYAMALNAQVEQRAKAEGWAEPRRESAVVTIWAHQVARVSLGATELGQPPERSALFNRWRLNVAQRTGLFHRASQVARQGRFDKETRIFDRIHRLKTQSDELGQRFGLRICTSN